MAETPDSPQAYAALLDEIGRIHDLGAASGVLHWDREVNMPAAGAAARIQQSTTLQRLIHERATTGAFLELVEAAEAESRPGDPIRDALLREVRINVDRALKLDDDFVARRSKLSGEAHQVWVKAREDDDFNAFRPYLEQVVDMGRELAERYGHSGEPYDALLDLYERGASTAAVAELFARTKAAIVPLREAIDASKVTIDDGPLHRDFDVDTQMRFARYIAAAVGYDMERGHIGLAVHPFATSFGRDDCRITTRCYPDFISPSLFGTLHECGHAMYEQGTAAALARTPLARGTSSGIHESQSRMIENIVGRSRAFWEAHYPRLQSHFPAALGNVDLDTFYAAINKVQPSLIRVEADELTYNLHIILRFELEQALLSGDLAVADLPSAWSDGMHNLLGIRPPNDRDGVLQDVHWTGPSFGYFPTYALGNLYAAQFHEAACATQPAVDRDLSEGNTTELLSWLRENVHRHGKIKTPAEICFDATGRALDEGGFQRYVTEKFGTLYGLTSLAGVAEV